LKVLEIDIETAPIVAYVWSLWDQNIATNQMVQPGYTLCFAARWQGSREVMFHSKWKDGEKAMIQAAHSLLDEDDMLVHYNGKKFDVPTLNREFVLQGLTPPSPYGEVDLFQVVKRRFKFASNRLDYVCEQLGLGTKVKHKGMPLWSAVMAGDPKAERTMERYNKGDVHLLDKLYHKVLPWIPNHPNRGLWIDNPAKPTCRNCGSTRVKKNGSEKRFTLSYDRYRCLDCGTHLRSRLSKGKRNVNVLV
jgi:hypothetical protein